MAAVLQDIKVEERPTLVMKSGEGKGILICSTLGQVLGQNTPGGIHHLSQ